jgi:competence ComEA-like helix-hairpin-helix protein
MTLPLELLQRRRRRRRRVVGTGLVALIAAAFGLWQRRSSGSRSDGDGRCAADEVRVDGRCVNRRIAGGGRIDLNTASVEELATIPGLGPELASAIIAARNKLGSFTSFDQLDAVPGIGPAKLKALQEHSIIR